MSRRTEAYRATRCKLELDGRLNVASHEVHWNVFGSVAQGAPVLGMGIGYWASRIAGHDTKYDFNERIMTKMCIVASLAFSNNCSRDLWT